MIRSLLRGVLSRVAKKVQKDGLFEKSGERSPTAPLPAKPAAGPAPTSVAQTTVQTPMPHDARPQSGCRPVDAAALRRALTPGQRPLVINHWATWCEPCVDELPRLVRSSAGLGETVEFMGVSWELFDHPEQPERAAAQVAGFADRSGVGYASVLFTGTPEELYEVCGLDWHFIPQTLVIAPNGKVVWHKKGTIEDSDVFPLIQAARGAI